MNFIVGEHRLNWFLQQAFSDKRVSTSRPLIIKKSSLIKIKACQIVDGPSKKVNNGLTGAPTRLLLMMRVFRYTACFKKIPVNGRMNIVAWSTGI